MVVIFSEEYISPDAVARLYFNIPWVHDHLPLDDVKADDRPLFCFCAASLLANRPHSGISPQNAVLLLIPLLRSLCAFSLESHNAGENHSTLPRNALLRLEDYNDPDASISDMDSLDSLLQEARDSNDSANSFFASVPETSDILNDFAHVLDKYEFSRRRMRERFNYAASVASYKDSQRSIAQNENMRQITQLAFIFIPVSFVTSIFGMNITPLSGEGAKWRTVLVGVIIVYILVALPFFVQYLKFRKSSAFRAGRDRV